MGAAGRLLSADRCPRRAARADAPRRARRGDRRIRLRRPAPAALGDRLERFAAVLKRKFAHFPDADDRAVLVLTGRLLDFDVGFAAQPALYGSMPATLFPSPGTTVALALLWVSAAQFTQLAWSELSYRLGRLRARFEVDEGGAAFEEVLVFASRFGAFCVDGEPVAMAAVPADGRRAPALSQEPALDAAAALAIGPGARAEALVRAIHEDFGALLPKLAETVNRESQRFGSERWTPFSPHR